MHIELSWLDGACTTWADPNESDFWQAVARILPELPVPGELFVRCALGEAAFKLARRGAYVENGEVKPSLYVIETFNEIQDLIPSSYSEAYLTCIHPESNNYKFYHLKPGSNCLRVTYGRIGSRRGEKYGMRDIKVPYPTYLYWIRYYEKLSKGYVDQTEIYLSGRIKKPIYNGIRDTDSPAAELYTKLKGYARAVIKRNFRHQRITWDQIEQSKDILRKLSQQTKVADFNAVLTNLLTLSPRKTKFVAELLANKTEDFSHIIKREEDLIAAMEGVITPEASFANLKIKVFKATAEQEAAVRARLSDQLKDKIHCIYRVINIKHRRRFDNYLQKNGNPQVREYWHGSRNENWFSILEHGLKLYPNAEITGKMFGEGIYFAPSSLKSWNYTSFYGTFWAGGNSDTAFMGLYATAYGSPLYAYNADFFTKDDLQRHHKHCIHAKAGKYLIADEIIFYDEAAVLLNYIVEFRSENESDKPI